MAIQQHPLPQDISSYRFRLIGDMTIKQFASLGIAIVLAVIVYSLPLPFFFKYPLSFLFIVLGVGMAFVPVQGRSLDVWIIAFIKSIYSPTQYVWKKTKEVPPEMALPAGQTTGTQAISNARIELNTGLPTSAPITSTVSVTSASSSDITNPAPVTKPIASEASSPVSQTVSTPAPSTPVTPVISPPPETTVEEVVPEIQQLIIKPEPSKPVAPITPADTETQLPIPFTPTTPNTLVGLTLTPEGKILEGVLVEIQKNNLTYRATKSNKLGQFMFARPLENGLYQILAEKEDYSFSPYSLDMTGTIIKPLKIQAQ